MCVQFVEMCYLSQPGNVDFVIEMAHKYGTIVRLWFGPYLGVILAEGKYVEVSKLALDF